jgi:hypothetical protein
MNIEAFLLCDAATDQQGKLNVLGAFDNIFAEKMPAIHSACSIVTRIRFEKIEEGNHPIKFNIIDADGNAICSKLEGNISVRFGEEIDSSVVNLILNIQRLEFKVFGQYQIDLAIDGQLQGSLPFSVREVPNRM